MGIPDIIDNISKIAKATSKNEVVNSFKWAWANTIIDNMFETKPHSIITTFRIVKMEKPI